VKLSNFKKVKIMAIKNTSKEISLLVTSKIDDARIELHWQNLNTPSLEVTVHDENGKAVRIYLDRKTVSELGAQLSELAD
jgi:hypothetical protein